VQTLFMRRDLDADVHTQIQGIAKGGDDLAHLLSNLLDRLGIGMARGPTPRSAPPVTAEAQRQGSRRRVLIAEEGLTSPLVLRLQLEVLGWEAEIAGTGAEALAQWHAWKPELILADSRMPGLNGLDLARSIRAAERETGTHVPILAILADDSAEDRFACLAAGMDEVLVRPIRLEDLRRVLEQRLLRAPAPLPTRAAADAPTAESGAVLDIGYLRRIVGDLSSVEVRKLLDLFTATVRADLPGCRQMLEVGDGRGVARLMHKLKSSARMVGALRFAHLAERMEDRAKTGQFGTAQSLYVELEHAVGDVEVALQRSAVPNARVQPGAKPMRLPPAIVPRRVLVVDDDSMARRQAGMLLTALGTEDVLAVDSGAAALAEIAQAVSPFDLLITDLLMPEMDGVEFLRRLTESGYRGDIVLCSGVDKQLLETAAELARAKGMALRGVIEKPLSRGALTDLLSSAAAQAGTPVPIEQDIRPQDILDALRRDEFMVWFQPKVDAVTLRVVGVEALARWQCRGHWVRPDLFIRIAERRGLIAPLSEVILRKALTGGVQLAEAGFPLVVAFNLSARWLSEIKLPEFVLEQIHTTGLKLENLVMEITETGVIDRKSTRLNSSHNPASRMPSSA
jgi:CheY-like chemotaxis protein